MRGRQIIQGTLSRMTFSLEVLSNSIFEIQHHGRLRGLGSVRWGRIPSRNTLSLIICYWDLALRFPITMFLHLQDPNPPLLPFHPSRTFLVQRQEFPIPLSHTILTLPRERLSGRAKRSKNSAQPQDQYTTTGRKTSRTLTRTPSATS